MMKRLPSIPGPPLSPGPPFSPGIPWFYEKCLLSKFQLSGIIIMNIRNKHSRQIHQDKKIESNIPEVTQYNDI